jgi:hypothetical protein
VIVRLDRVATAPTSESETLGHAGEPRSALATAAFAVFLLFVAAVPWSIAAMSFGLAMAASRPSWSGSPVPPGGGGHGRCCCRRSRGSRAVIAALFAEDRGASLPRITKGALPAIAWITSYHARRRRDGERALTVLLVSAGVVALLGIGVWVAQGAAFPARYAGGAFIGQHGSWNRSVPSGYKVIFVPFRDGQPACLPRRADRGRRGAGRDLHRSAWIACSCRGRPCWRSRGALVGLAPAGAAGGDRAACLS